MSTHDLITEATRLANRAAAYRTAGARDLAQRCMVASNALAGAADALERLAAAEDAARRIAGVE